MIDDKRYWGDRELPPSYEQAVIMLIDGLRAYLPWLQMWADGDYDRYENAWVIEPNAAAKKDFDYLLRLCDDLEALQLGLDALRLPKDLAKRLSPRP